MGFTIKFRFNVGDECFIVLGCRSDTPVVVEAVVKSIEYQKDNKTSSTVYHCNYEPFTQASTFCGDASQVFKTRKEAMLYAKASLTERFNNALNKLEKQIET